MRLFILILLAFLANQSAAQGLIDPELANKVHQCAQKKNRFYPIENPANMEKSQPLLGCA